MYCNQVVTFFLFEDTAALIPTRRSEPFQEGTEFLWLTVCANLSKLLMKCVSVYTLHDRNPKMILHLQSQKTTSLLIKKKISLNNQIDNFFHPSDFKTRFVASFPPKDLSNTVIDLNSQQI